MKTVVSPSSARVNATVIYATGATVGDALAANRALATPPISFFVVGMVVCIRPTGMIARGHGRRAAFLAETGCGTLSGLLASIVAIVGSFWMFCLGTFLGAPTPPLLSGFVLLLRIVSNLLGGRARFPS